MNIKTYVSRIIREPVDSALRLLPDAGRSAARESRLTRRRRRHLHAERTDLHGISEEHKHWQTGAIVNSVQPKPFDLLSTDHLPRFSPKRKGSRYARLIRLVSTIHSGGLQSGSCPTRECVTSLGISALLNLMRMVSRVPAGRYSISTMVVRLLDV